MTLQRIAVTKFGKRGFKELPATSKAPSRTDARARRAGKAMTLQEIAVKELGRRGFEKLPPRLKKLLLDVDALAINQKPVSRRLMEKALS
jgi:hypothetical protein